MGRAGQAVKLGCRQSVCGGRVGVLPRTRAVGVSRQPEPIQGAFGVTA